MTPLPQVRGCQSSEASACILFSCLYALALLIRRPDSLVLQGCLPARHLGDEIVIVLYATSIS